ncbi:MAG: helix-turn-helix transcriptional regulator [Chloroflexota bacterium]
MHSGPRANELSRELSIACAAAGVTQRELAQRIGISQSSVGRLLTDGGNLRVDVADAIARACGYRLAIKVVPGHGITLRDSGQLTVAQIIQSHAQPPWQGRLEVPVAGPPDRRAIDLLLMHPDEIVGIEIERWLRDLQAQLRAGQLKRLALAERMGRAVRLVLAVPDTVSARRAINPFLDLIAQQLPVTSRQAWARIRSGEPIGGDALLWVR